MSKAPERIWAFAPDIFDNCSLWQDMPSPAGDTIEYVRADRIEELEAENRLFRDAVYIDDLTVTMQADDRSKAMVAMKRALDFLNADMPTEAKTALRATLAELTGGKDE